MLIFYLKTHNKTRSIQRTQTHPRLWPLTLTCDLDLTSRSRNVTSLDVVYSIEPWFQVWCLLIWWFARYDHLFIFVTFDLHLWPSAYVKVTFTLISRCTLCSCTLLPRMKFVGSIEFEIWTIVCWKLNWRHNDVITHSNLIKFKHKTTKGISKRQTEFHFDWT